MRKLNLAVSMVAGALLFSLAQAQNAFDGTEQLSKTELKELVAPIALYPDDLVAVVLPSSAYPLQLVQAQRLLDAGDQPDSDWDESVVAVMNYPEIVELLNEDLDWTYSLGLAFINQESATFDAIQAFRSDALAAGNLKSDDYQVVRVDRGIIRIESRSEKEIYIPYYEPQRVVVRHVVPVYDYYPVARPIYYYPYPAHYAFRVNHFYGVGTYFSIGWQHRGLSLHYSTGTAHPYAGHYYSANHYYFKPRVRHNYYGGKKHHYTQAHYKPVRHKVRHKARHKPQHARINTKRHVQKPHYRKAATARDSQYRPSKQRVSKKSTARRHDAGRSYTPKQKRVRAPVQARNQRAEQQARHKPQVQKRDKNSRIAKRGSEHKKARPEKRQRLAKAEPRRQKAPSRGVERRSTRKPAMSNQRQARYGQRSNGQRSNGHRNSGRRANGIR